MKKKNVLSAAIAGTILASAAMTLHVASAAEDYEAPLNEWGQPDLRGVYNFSSNTPMQRPRELGTQEFLTLEEVHARDERLAAEAAAGDGQSSQGGVGGYNQFWVEGAPEEANLRSSIIIYPEDGRMPARVEGAPIAFGGLGPDYNGERPVRVTVGGIAKDGPEDRGLSERCLLGFNSVPPFAPSMYNNNVQLFQNKDYAVIYNEMIHESRIVRLHDKEHIPEDIRQWTGDSIGWYEGDSLVVETKNFNNKTQTFYGTGDAGESKTLIEKFTRRSDSIVDYEFTVIDPDAYQDKIVGTFPLVATNEQIFEYACHEGNYGMYNILQGQRVEDGTWDRENNRVIGQ